MLIVEEYIPEYRRRFFEMLEAALASESIGLSVAVGASEHATAARGDTVSEASFVRRVPAASVSLNGRRLTYRRLGALASDARLVIVDQALRHLETYPLLIRQRHGPPVALWGHGARSAKRASRVERLLERRLTSASHWFFAYTRRGVETVAATGFPRDRITLVQNTIDVDELAGLRRAVSARELERVRSELGLAARNACVFIGALDSTKRIAFLLEAGAILARRLPDFRLVLAGDGPERDLVERSLSSQPWLRYVGRATDARKAELGAVADLLLMPGAVGLVAVDSFALQTPIVTTDWPFHGPEFDYLENGVNACIARDDVADFARTVERVLTDRSELDRLRSACLSSAARYSLAEMVANYTSGVLAALRAPRRRRGRLLAAGAPS